MDNSKNYYPNQWHPGGIKMWGYKKEIRGL